jgi:hypothetical protein
VREPSGTGAMPYGVSDGRRHAEVRRQVDARHRAAAVVRDPRERRRAVSIETVMAAAATIHPVLRAWRGKSMWLRHPSSVQRKKSATARGAVAPEIPLTLSVVDAKPIGNGAAAGRASAHVPIHPKRRLSIVISMQRVAVVTLLVTGLVMGGIGSGVAEAKAKKKAVVQVFVDGKKFKNSKRNPPAATYQTLTGLFTVIAGSQKGGLRSVSIKSLNFSSQVDLSVLPVTVPAFTALYSDNTYKGLLPGPPKSWAGDGLNITIESFDGSRISGKFEGSLPPGDNVTAPASFTGGKFNLPILVQ